MLESLRKNTSSWFLKGLLLLCAIAMGMFGVDQINTQGTRGADAAAWVNGDVITQYEFQQAVSNQMAYYQRMLGDQFDESFIQRLGIPQNVMNGLINAKLMAQQASKMDMIVPDTELSDYIRSIPQLQTKDGKFDYEAYQQIPNKGMIERQERAQLQVSKLRTYIEDRIHLTPEELKLNYRLQNTKLKLKFAEIDFAALARKHKPSKAEIDKILASAPEEEFKKRYESNQARFTQKAQAKLRQIRVALPYQSSEESKLAARKTIDEISAEVNPTNFSEVAKKRSDDEYAKKGGEVGWLDRGTLDPELEKAIDALAPGQVSGPIETTAGYYIVLVDQKKEAVARPLEEVKPELAKDMAVDVHRRELEESKTAAWEKQLSAGKSIESQLKKEKIAIKTTRQFSLLDGRIPEIGNADDILADVIKLTQQKPVAPKLYAFRGKHYFVALEEITPADMGAFAKEYANVEQTVKGSLRAQLVRKWEEKLREEASIKQEINFGPQPPTMVQ